jgi:hypothetical protein
LVCPSCDRPLRYRRSHIGGVSTRYPEQWDEFVCPTPDRAEHSSIDNARVNSGLLLTW